MSGGKNKERNNWVILIVITIFLICLILYGFYRPYNFNFSGNSTSHTESSSVSLLVVGDMMLDRNVRNTINRIGFDKYFSGVKDLIQGVDVAVANLEGAFTTYESVTSSLKSKELVFTFDPALSPALSDLGFDILGLANNHSYNFGQKGLEMTRRYIGGAGMFYYGDPFNKDEMSTVITKNGIKVGFVGFHEFYYTNFDKVFLEIARLKKEVDVLIVTPHWGPEYIKEPTEKMVQWAHQFIDSGADVVVGTHSHIIGSTEIYNNKKIYYSLGNFAFDQYFSKATMEGLAVILNIEKNEDEVRIIYEDILIDVGREGIGLKN